MSARRTPLKHPVVILGVAAGLLAVGVLNLQTFGPRLGLLGAGGDQAPDPLVPPPDLEMVVQAARDGSGPRPFATAGDGGATVSMRDPFTSGPSPAPPGPAPAPSRRAPAAAAPLVCSAVLLGGERPLALIDGHAAGPGDQVRGHEILTISTDGVTLRAPDGDQITLAVGPQTLADGAYHVVTGTRPADAGGQTRLSASRSPERTER